MVVRPSQPSDASQVVQMVKEIFRTEFSKDQSAYPTEDLEHLSETYAGPASTFLIAEDDSKVVGTCGVKAESPQTAILRRLFVASSHRSKGVGSKLLEEALRFCRQKGFKEVIIRTSTRMQAAIRLCSVAGFKEEGRWTLGEVTLVRLRLKLSS